MATVQSLIQKGASVLVVDENGHTPALSCAATNRVADCLAIILATMMPFSPNNTSTALLLKTNNKINSGTITLGRSRLERWTFLTMEKYFLGGKLFKIGDFFIVYQIKISETGYTNGSV